MFTKLRTYFDCMNEIILQKECTKSVCVLDNWRISAEIISKLIQRYNLVPHISAETGSLESVRFFHLFRMVKKSLKIHQNLTYFEFSRINIETSFWKIIKCNLIYNYRKTQRNLHKQESLGHYT